MPARILIADDDAVVRHVVRAGLGTAGFTVVAEAADGQDALEKATALSPDVVILDLRMPKMNGIEVASVLRRQQFSQAKIILLTMYDIGDTLVGASGINAVVAKTDGLTKLVDRVRQLVSNDAEAA